MNKQSDTNHVAYMDFIKAVSIAGIFFWHYCSFVNHDDYDLAQVLPVSADSLWRMFLYIGRGMPMFFVIASGFGLYLSYLRRRDRWGVFFKKRAVRVLPLYYAALIVSYLISQGAIPLEGFIYNLLLIQTYTRYETTFGALWFISYIVQLYLLFPFIVMLMRNSFIKWLLIPAAFLMDYCLRQVIPLLGYDIFTGKLPTRYLPLFLFGIILAEMYHENRLQHVFNPLTIGICCALLAIAVAGQMMTELIPLNLFENVMYALLFVCLYPLYQLISLSRISLWLISAVSYGSYVFIMVHHPFFRKILQGLYIEGLVKVSFADGTYTFENTAGVTLLAIPLFVSCAALSWAIQRAYDRLVKRAKLA